MKFEIKKLKTMGTRDGRAWSCELHADGVKWADVDNDGRGGQTRFDWTVAAPRPLVEIPGIDRQLAPKPIADLVAAMPPAHFQDLDLEPDLALWIEDLVEIAERDKRVAAAIRRGHTVVRLAGAPEGDLMIWRHPCDKGLIAHIGAEHPGAQILNLNLNTAA